MAVVKSWFLIAISCTVLLAPYVATSQTRQDQAVLALQAELAKLNNVVADFDQQITNTQGYLTESSRGKLYLSKPKFRWEVFTPFPQVILAKGDRIEIYDPDLEQVTQRALGDAVHEAPLALLTRADLQLEEYFSVFAVADSYTLVPLSDEALFDRLEIAFVDGVLSQLTIHDHAGQQTLIRFSHYRAEQVLQSDVFELDYPDGTDFVRG